MRGFLRASTASFGLIALGAAAATPAITLVVCAPGYPGSTEQAQPSMDALASAAARGAGWAEGDLGAVYYEKEAAGLARLGRDDAGAALVPLPFFLLHGADLGCQARLQVVETESGEQVWSLVAEKGKVAAPKDLDGWEVTGRPGYAPAFVRGPVLGSWGSLPATARITFTNRSLGALRRAAAGEKVAVILDRQETEALPALPFASSLAVVTKSAPLPGTILCTIDGKMGAVRADQLVKSLLGLQKQTGGAELLHGLRMTRFEKIDAAALERARLALTGS